MNRRDFLKLSVSAAAVAGMSGFGKFGKIFAEDIGKLTLSNDEWKKRLSPDAYDVLRHEGTERPFTSPLLKEHRDGIFACLACNLSLFPSKYKYDSGTGWPSFFDSIPGHVETKTDSTLGMVRKEFHCARCGGHLGHIFDDGPQPTGLRYCANGVALKFIPNDKS